MISETNKHRLCLLLLSLELSEIKDTGEGYPKIKTSILLLINKTTFQQLSFMLSPTWQSKYTRDFAYLCKLYLNNCVQKSVNIGPAL